MLIRYCYIVIFTCALFGSCTHEESVQYPVPREKRAPADALFVPVDSRVTKILVNNRIEETLRRNGKNDPSLYFGGGVAVLDYDRDSFPDLCFTERQGGVRLFRNKGGFQFAEVTQEAGVQALEGEKSGVTVVDVNADGWPDLYVCRTGPNAAYRKNLLFVNNRRGGFTERAREFGLDDGGASHQAVFFDADQDGDLDCFVVNHPDTTARFYKNEGLQYTSPQGKTPRYTAVPGNAGILPKGFLAGVLAADLNRDGWTDLVFSDFSGRNNQVFINKKSIFTERSVSLFAPIRNTSRGLDAGDVDGNGIPDVIKAGALPADLVRRKLFSPFPDSQDMVVTRNVLHFGLADGTWIEGGLAAGIAASGNSWSPLFQDFDLDGYSDLFISTGVLRDFGHRDLATDTVSYREFPGGALPNVCFRNTGDGRFEDVSHAWGFVRFSISTGAATADLDRDGDLDIVVNNLEAFPTVYRNRAAERKLGGWLQVELRGVGLNAMGLGAQVSVYIDSVRTVREFIPQRGFLSSSAPWVHFGLGKAPKVDSVEVWFPGNKRWVMRNVAVNRFLTADVREAQTVIPTPPTAPTPYLQWVDSPSWPFQAPGAEAIPPLHPFAVGTPRGPVLAVGDVNGDKLDDFFIGHTRHNPPGLYIQRPNGTFQRSATGIGLMPPGTEASGARFFDADGDGDRDLLVTLSGEGTASAGPRLYRNDGRGRLTIYPEALPMIRHNTGPICVADYDGDGDQDIFIGSVEMADQPGNFTPGYLLTNQKGIFTNATETVAAEWSVSGPMQALVWNDFDGDRLGELVVANSWQPLRMFALENGVLTDVSYKFGLTGSASGLWRSLISADVDGDGDNDLIAGNFGLNTALYATRKHPLKRYFTDFTHHQAVVTESYEAYDLPWATRSAIISAYPDLQEKLRSYEIYSKSTIYNIVQQPDSRVEVVNELASGVFYNNRGRFIFSPLPVRAQFAPGNAVLAIAPADSFPAHLLITGNYSGISARLQAPVAGRGVVMQPDATGVYRVMTLEDAGLNIAANGSALGLLRTSGNRQLVVAVFRDHPPRIYRVRENMVPTK